MRFPKVRHEGFKDVASGVQSIVFTLSIVVVGAWTIYTFDALNARDRAQAELTETQQRIRELGIVTVELSAQAERLPSNEDYYVRVTATIKNLGNRAMRLDLGERVVAATKVVHDGDTYRAVGPISRSGLITFIDVDQSAIGALAYTLLDSEESQSLEFWLLVDGPGLYLVEFRALTTGADEERNQDVAEDTAQSFAAKALTYVVVQ